MELHALTVCRLAPALSDTLEPELTKSLSTMVRPQVIKTILDIIKGTNNANRKLLSGVGDTITCKELSAVIIGLKDGICCEVVGAFYMLVVSYIIIGLTMVLFGGPAGILGYKRFPLKVWGPYVDNPEYVLGEIPADGDRPTGVSNAVVPLEMLQNNENNHAAVPHSPAAVAPESHTRDDKEDDKEIGEI